MLDSRGHQLGHEMSRVLAVPGTPPEAVQKLARDILVFVQSAGYAHLEPEPEFVENFLQGWYASPLIRKEESHIVL